MRRSPTRRFSAAGCNDDGVQLRWVAPTDLFVELGAELGRGAQFPGTRPQQERRRRGALFGHLGGDIGASTAWRAGLSYLRTSPRGPRFDDVDSLGNAVTQSFTGKSRLWIADSVLKWAPTATRRHQLQAAGRVLPPQARTATLTYDDTRRQRRSSARSPTATRAGSRAGTLQGVYQFMPRWRVGYRYDRLRPRHGRQRHRRQRPRADGGRFPAAHDRPQPDAQHADARLEPDRVQPLAAAARVGQVARRA